jgi:uncharacterized membrane protein
MAESVTVQAPAASRIESIDMVRGIAILLMIMGHSYDYLSYEAAAVMGAASPLPLAMLNVNVTTVFVFFNRWITHSGAPIFLFLAGVGAYLWAHKGGVQRSLAGFLIPRGLLLIALQLTRTVMQLFTSKYPASLDVLWSIGMSMILLSFFSRVPRSILLVLSVAILAGHGLPAVYGYNGEGNVLWQVFMTADTFAFVGGTSIFNRFPVIPWFGLMLLGYAIGHLFLMPLKERKNVFLYLGLGLLVVFVLIAACKHQRLSAHVAGISRDMEDCGIICKHFKIPAFFVFFTGGSGNYFSFFLHHRCFFIEKSIFNEHWVNVSFYLYCASSFMQNYRN